MNRDNKIRLLIVDDSLVFCRFLSTQLPMINSKITVVGHAMNAFDAMKKVTSLKPDVISLDVEMPGMNGIDFLKKLIPEHPIPVVLVSSLNVGVFDALSYGAVDFVRKPDMSKEYSTSTFAHSLAAKILMASRASVKVPRTAAAGKPALPRQEREQTEPVSPGNQASGSAPAPERTGSRIHINLPQFSAGQLRLKDPSSLKLKNTVIALGASTGGTEATREVLKDLPADTPGIVVTQHMPEGFTKMYAERLNRLCAMDVKEAENGDIIRQGLVLIAPGGDCHMKVAKKGVSYSVTCTPGEKVNGHRPSVDVLFHSVAQTVKSDAIGIILTGMGGDGAEGLLAMRKNGAYTIGQDKESCVVYGMPMVAQKIGAVCSEVPCSKIATLLVNHLNTL